MDTKKRRLFFDIETSFNIGWFWRAGWNQTIGSEQIIEERKIICISWKWADEDEVHNLTWDKKQSDKSMLKRFMKVMAKADEVIAHNGDRFDIKWLRTRCLFHRISAFPHYHSLDTLKVAKGGFNFNSNKLDYIAKFLNVGEKMDTGGIDLWKNVILNNDREALQNMVEYCDQDVLVLEAVFNELKNYAKHKTHFGVLAGGDKYECPECGSCEVKLKRSYTTAMGTPRRNLECKKCKKNYVVNNKTYMDLLQYKIRNGLK